MFCKKCGNQIGEGAAFCGICGTPVENVGKMPESEEASVNTLPLRVGIIVASVLMILSTVLPFFEAMGQSVSLLNANGQVGDGIIYIIFAGLIILFVCLRKKIPVLVFGILSFLMYCYEMQVCKDVEEYASGLVSKGSGYYWLIVSVIGLLVVCIVYCVKEKGQKGR